MTKSSTLRALSHRDFLLFFIGVYIATSGQFMQSRAVLFYMNELTDSNRSMILLILPPPNVLFYMNELTDSNAWVGVSAFALLVPPGDLLSMRLVVLFYGGLLAVFWLVTLTRSNGFAGLGLGSGQGPCVQALSSGQGFAGLDLGSGQGSQLI